MKGVEHVVIVGALCMGFLAPIFAETVYRWNRNRKRRKKAVADIRFLERWYDDEHIKGGKNGKEEC